MSEYSEIINSKYTNNYEKTIEIGNEIRKKFYSGKQISENEMVILCIRELEDDVCQDGIEGYLDNMYKCGFFPDHFAYTVKALKEIGAEETWKRFKEIYNRYGDMKEYDYDRMEKESEVEYLASFDRWFYRCSEDFEELQYQYIMKYLA